MENCVNIIEHTHKNSKYGLFFPRVYNQIEAKASRHFIMTINRKWGPSQMGSDRSGLMKHATDTGP